MPPPNPQVIEKNGQKFIEAPGMGLIPVDELYANGGQDESWLHKAGAFVKGATPEITAGLASALKLSNPILGMAAPPVVAGATDIARQYGETGDLRKVNYGEAAMRGASNIIPDMSENILTSVADKGGAAVGDIAKNTMLHGPKGGLIAGLMAKLGLGKDVAAAAPAASELSRMTLADGTRVLSSDGLKQLVAKSIELDNLPQGSRAAPAQRQALDVLIKEVESALHPTNLTAADLLSKLKMPTSTSDAIAAAADAAAKKVKVNKIGQNLNYGLRTALGMTQGTLAAGSE